MPEKLAETIKRISRNHLENGGMLLGQCLTAVGWVGGTVPEMTGHEGLVELSMSDVAGGGIAVGAALAGKRPIYVVRYQGFQWYNAPSILNYAAKSKEMWNVPCPMFVRSIAMEGGIGPVASNSHHSIFTRMPGIKVCAPMTPGEYEKVWNRFMKDDEPYYVSEHRRSFGIDYEMKDKFVENADITLLPISASRLNTLEALKVLENENIRYNISHILWLKPFEIDSSLKSAVASSTYGGLVLDGDYENGISKCLAYDLMHATGKPVKVLALEEKTAGFAPYLDNLPPSSERIVSKVREIVNR